MRPLVAIAAFAVAACGDPDLVFAVDPQFSAEERADIERAAAQWNERTTTPIRFGRHGGWRLEKVAWGGITRRGAYIIEINDDLPVFLPVLHEFGHALGLRHTCFAPLVPGKRSSDEPCGSRPSFGVMDAAHATPEFTEFDMAECRRAGACDE